MMSTSAVAVAPLNVAVTLVGQSVKAALFLSLKVYVPTSAPTPTATALTLPNGVPLAVSEITTLPVAGVCTAPSTSN